MKKIIFQIILLLSFASFCFMGFFAIRHILNLPFRSTNDTLHEEESFFNLDLLIPSGTHIDEKSTILDVIKIRTQKGEFFYKQIIQPFSELIPLKYRFPASLFLFLFWSFLYMIFFRIFTFMGYGRALRGSLFLGGCTYYFMPDFLPGIMDDIIIVGVAVWIILFKAFHSHFGKKGSK